MSTKSTSGLKIRHAHLLNKANFTLVDYDKSSDTVVWSGPCGVKLRFKANEKVKLSELFSMTSKLLVKRVMRRISNDFSDMADQSCCMTYKQLTMEACIDDIHRRRGLKARLAAK